MRKVLVIDDDLDLLEIVTIMLSNNGFEVHSSPFEPNIHETILMHKPDLVLLDVLLGGYSGIDICREIKKVFSDLPVIIFSADSRNSTSHLACGAIDFIAKPFDIDDLIRRVNMHLKHPVKEF